MIATQSFVASPVRARALRVTLFVLLAAALAAAAWVCGRQQRWHGRLLDVRFIDHREYVAGGGASVGVTGYVLARVESDVDFFRMARAEKGVRRDTGKNDT